MTAQILVTKIMPVVSPSDLDILALTGENSIGIQESKTIKPFLTTKPYKGNLKTILIYPAEKLTREAQNALLKILEEPPDFALIRLYTPTPQRLLPTILSRCELVYPKTAPAPKNNLPTPKLINLLQDSKNPAQALFQANQIKLTRIELMAELEAGLDYYAAILLDVPNPQNVGKAKLLLSAYGDISQNSSPTLSLAHLFLHWKLSD